MILTAWVSYAGRYRGPITVQHDNFHLLTDILLSYRVRVIPPAWTRPFEPPKRDDPNRPAVASWLRSCTTASVRRWAVRFLGQSTWTGRGYPGYLYLSSPPRVGGVSCTVT